MRRLNLLARILLLSMLVIGLVSLLGLAMVIGERVDSADQRYRQEARGYLVALTPTLQNALVVGDLEIIQQTFDQLVREENLQRIALLDSAHHRVIIEAHDPENPVEQPQHPPPGWFVALLHLNSIVTEQALHFAGADYGTLRLEMSAAPLLQRLWEAIRRFVLVGLGSMAAILAILGIVLWRGLAPLQLLTEGAHRMEAGALDTRIPHIDTPEIAVVGEAFNDMADRIVARENQLKEANARAEGAARAKAAFLATMSHEIRTPMNGIIGLTDLALSTELTVEQRGYLELIKISADNLLVILNDILDYSKIDAGKLKIETVPMNLRELVPQILALFAPRADEKRIGLWADLAPDLPDIVLGDPVRVRQVLTNLISNAVKFTRQGQVILRIEPTALSSDRATLRFGVADSGIGIAPDKIHAILEPFTQADDSTTRYYGGTGLGLAICTNLVRLMGGELAVSSELGVGSRFSFSLDMPLAAERRQQPRAAVPMAVAAGHARILVAEDSSVNQALVRAILAKHGYAFHIANDGREALAAYQSAPFDLILMDLQMPNLDGLAATAQIRALEQSSGRHIPIVALSANAFDEDRARCLLGGMDDFLTKPFKQDALLASIQRNLPAA